MKSFLPLLHFFLVLNLIAPAAFIGEPVYAADALPVVQAGDASSHASDRILIKFASGVAPRATVQGALATGHASLDGLLSAYQVQAAAHPPTDPHCPRGFRPTAGGAENLTVRAVTESQTRPRTDPVFPVVPLPDAQVLAAVAAQLALDIVIRMPHFLMK